MLKKVLLALAIALMIVGLVIQFQPNSYSVERSISIAAPATAVFPLVNDFHQWGEWSPWEKLDPAMKRTYSGPPSGTGSVYQWSGNSQAGEGRMTIADSQSPSTVGINLEFIKPFPASSVTTFHLQPEGSGTRVNWNMTGASNFMTKAMGLFSSMDKMIGPDFEKGLAQLKARAEASGDSKTKS